MDMPDGSEMCPDVEGGATRQRRGMSRVPGCIRASRRGGPHLRGVSGGRAEDVGLQGALHVAEHVGFYDCSF